MKIKTVISVLLAAFLAAGRCSCSGGSGGTVYAQSVRSLTGTDAVGSVDRFAGVAVSGRTVEVKKDPDLKVEEVKVEEGQLVEAGDVLFVYSNESAELNVEQAKLEIESLKNKIDIANSQIAELIKERDAADSADRLGYTLEIQGLEADIKETQYNIGVKEKALKTLEAAVGDTQVKSEIAGRVTSVNTSGEVGEDGSEKPFITIVEVGNLRVKGVINEMNRGALGEGDAVTVRSRTDETRTWKGTVKNIDWENAEQTERGGGMFIYDSSSSDEMTTSSRYPFYVTVEDPEGLIIGQHVYIEPGESSARTDALILPAAFVCDADDAAWVWALGGRDRLEKREVTLGAYDENADGYEILSGLTRDDYVAFPDDTLQPGMKAEKTEGYIPGEAFGDDFIDGFAFEGEPGDTFDGGEAEDGIAVYEGAVVGGEEPDVPETPQEGDGQG